MTKIGSDFIWKIGRFTTNGFWTTSRVSRERAVTSCEDQTWRFRPTNWTWAKRMRWLPSVSALRRRKSSCCRPARWQGTPSFRRVAHDFRPKSCEEPWRPTFWAAAQMEKQLTFLMVSSKKGYMVGLVGAIIKNVVFLDHLKFLVTTCHSLCSLKGLKVRVTMFFLLRCMVCPRVVAGNDEATQCPGLPLLDDGLFGQCSFVWLLRLKVGPLGLLCPLAVFWKLVQNPKISVPIEKLWPTREKTMDPKKAKAKPTSAPRNPYAWNSEHSSAAMWASWRSVPIWWTHSPLAHSFNSCGPMFFILDTGLEQFFHFEVIIQYVNVC